MMERRRNGNDRRSNRPATGRRLSDFLLSKGGPSNLGDLRKIHAYRELLAEKRPDATPPTEDELAETLLQHAREARRRSLAIDAATRFTLETAAARLKGAAKPLSRDPWKGAR